MALSYYWSKVTTGWLFVIMKCFPHSSGGQSPRSGCHVMEDLGCASKLKPMAVSWRAERTLQEGKKGLANSPQPFKKPLTPSGGAQPSGLSVFKFQCEETRSSSSEVQRRPRKSQTGKDGARVASLDGCLGGSPMEKGRGLA